MARKRPSEPDEGQFSLDDFMNQEPASSDNVPDMIDLSNENTTNRWQTTAYILHAK
jgi:hypothetical protein